MLKTLLIAVPILFIAFQITKQLVPWETRRKMSHYGSYIGGVVGSILALTPLVFLMIYLVKEGGPGFTAAFFTESQKPIGQPGGGYLNAIVGSLLIILMASGIGVPIGVLAGIYLAEVGKGRFAATVRFLSEVLTGLPSIVAGILGYTLIVMKIQDVPGWKPYSGFAGAVALSFLMIPVITRVTEEAIRLVPKAQREASFGLGVGQWRTVWHVVLPAARSAILTGVVLAVARVGGETAPLLFTALGNREIITNVREPMSALPLAIYFDAGSPSDINVQLAVTGALFLVVWIALVNLVIRWIAAKTQPKLS